MLDVLKTLLLWFKHNLNVPQSLTQWHALAILGSPVKMKRTIWLTRREKVGAKNTGNEWYSDPPSVIYYALY